MGVRRDGWQGFQAAFAARGAVGNEWLAIIAFQAAYWCDASRQPESLCVVLAREFVYGFYENFNVFGRGVLVDAVPKVEDVSVSVSIAC